MPLYPEIWKILFKKNLKFSYHLWLQVVEEMPLYPHSILKKPSEFPPVPFNIDEEDDEADNESLDILLPNRDLNDFSDFDRPATKPGQF